MFNELKGGSVMLCNGGKYRTVNIAVFAEEATLYAKVSGSWFSILKAGGQTSHGLSWKHLTLPATYGHIADSARGAVQVENLVKKIAKRVTG